MENKKNHESNNIYYYYTYIIYIFLSQFFETDDTCDRFAPDNICPRGRLTTCSFRRFYRLYHSTLRFEPMKEKHVEGSVIRQADNMHRGSKF